jgi:hypothetical protein
MTVLSRRRFLQGVGGLASALALASCGPLVAMAPAPLHLAVVRRLPDSPTGDEQALWQGAELAWTAASAPERQLLALATVGAQEALGARLGGLDVLLAPAGVLAGCSPTAGLPAQATAVLYLTGGPGERARPGDCRARLVCWLGPTAAQLAVPLGAWARRELGQRAAVWRTDDPWSQALAVAFRRGFAGERSVVVGERALPATAAEAARSLDAQQPELVFVAARGEALYAFLTAYAAAKLWRQARLVGIADTATLSALRALGAAAGGLIVSSGWLAAADTPANNAFVDAYHERFHDAPTELAVQGYEAARLLLTAAERLAVEPFDRLALAQALAHGQLDGPRGAVRLDLARGGIVQDVLLVELKPWHEQVVPVVLERVVAVGPEG